MWGTKPSASAKPVFKRPCGPRQYDHETHGDWYISLCIRSSQTLQDLVGERETRQRSVIMTEDWVSHQPNESLNENLKSDALLFIQSSVISCTSTSSVQFIPAVEHVNHVAQMCCLISYHLIKSCRILKL